MKEDTHINCLYCCPKDNYDDDDDDDDDDDSLLMIRTNKSKK